MPAAKVSRPLRERYRRRRAEKLIGRRAEDDSPGIQQRAEADHPIRGPFWLEEATLAEAQKECEQVS